MPALVSRFSNLRIRTRLLAASITFSGLLAASGAAGLHFSGKINDSVTVVSRVAAPVSAAAAGIRETAARFRLGLAAMSIPGGNATVPTIRSFDGMTSRHLTALEAIVAQHGLNLPVAELQAGKSRVAKVARRMIDLQGESKSAADAADRQGAEFETQRAALETRAAELAAQHDSFVRLGALLAQLNALAAAQRSAMSADAMAAAEGKFTQVLAAARQGLHRAAAQLVDDAARGAAQKLAPGLDAIEAAVLKDGGLFAATREAARLAADMNAAAAELDVAIADYDKVLNRISAEAEALASRADAEASESARTAEWSLATLVGTGIALSLLLGLLLANSVSRPIARIIAAMNRLAEGDTALEIPGVGRRDEVGDIAASVQVFRDNMIETERLRAEQETMKEQAAAAQRAAMRRTADDFEARVKQVIDKVANAATTMRGTAEQLSRSAEATTRQSHSVANASEQTSGNVQLVATASEELTASIGEISRQIGLTVQITSDAASEAERTGQTVDMLADAAQHIGEVVKLINEIAGQTNLLALNATIEAARAGDAGRGFAVVAAEVKALANQTAQATGDIRQQIAAIQGATGQTVQAIRGIGNTVQEISRISAAVAAAVEQQSAATGEIAGNVNQAARGTQEISYSIREVTEAASNTGNAADHLLAAATDLSQEAEKLQDETLHFIDGLRKAA